MIIADAKKLKRGSKVWVTYKNPARNEDISCPGTVTHAGSKVYKNMRGTKYMWITVSAAHNSAVYPSWCLSKL